MKKTLLLIMSVFAFAVLIGCKGEEYPQLSEPNELYFNAKDGNYTYSVTNKEAYDELKEKVGLNLLLDEIDKGLLKAVKKDGKSYWDSVSEDEVTKKVEEDIFPSGKEDLTEDEMEEAREKFYDDMFIRYGFNTEAEIREYYRLTLARRLYASDHVLDGEKDEDGNPKTDFTDKEYENYYKNNYKKGFYAIIVAYETPKLASQALEALGVQIDKGVWKDLNGNALTDVQIVEKFIGLYNSAYSHRAENYPSNSYILNADVHYEYSDGAIVFNLDAIEDELFYEYNEIQNYDSLLLKSLENNLKSYGEGSDFYLKNPMSNSSGNRHYLMMKIGEKAVPAFEDVQEDIRKELVSGKLSSTMINRRMAELRKANNLVIYDDVLEAKYINQISELNVEYKENKKLNGNLVAKTDVAEYSADDLFEVMSKGYGLTLVASKIEFQMLLFNPKYNTIYSMNENLKEEDRILDESQYKAIKNEIKDEKDAFEAGEYTEYGYPPKIGWKKFIEARYGVKTEKEVFNLLLYNRIKDNYAKSLGKITDAESDLADFYLEKMQEQVDKYFKVKGSQLVIEVLDKDGKAVKPEKWTDKQREYAELFYEDVLNLLAPELEEGETYEKRLTNLITAFKKAPRFVAGMAQNKENQPLPNEVYVYNGIEISKYKTAGLNLRYSDLGTFTNGSKAEALNDAAKAIWDANPDSKDPVIYGLGEEEIPYIITDEGYHVYINLETTPLAEWTTGEVLPTIEHILKYERNSSDSTLTTKIKTAITTYYKPIYDELVGTYNLTINLYENIKDLTVEIKHGHYTVSELERYLDLQIESNRKQLKFNA